jgi:hypothetical protein
MKAVQLLSRGCHSHSLQQTLFRRRRPLSTSTIFPRYSVGPSRLDCSTYITTLTLSQRPGKKRYLSDSSSILEGDDSSSLLSSSSSYNYYDNIHESNDYNFSLSSSSSPKTRPSPPPDVALDKVTHYYLHPNTIPLGTMKLETWHDIVDIIIAWLEHVKSGRAADAATRLLNRLWMEHYANTFTSSMIVSTLSPSVVSQERYEMLLQLQQKLVRSWVECAISTRQLRSDLALFRAELELWRLRELAFDTDGTSFPMDEYTLLIEACLNLELSDTIHQQRGIDKAADLLLKVFGTTNDTMYVSLSIFADRIGPLFEQCVVQLLRLDAKSQVAIELLETMTALKESAGWSNLTLPAEAERILLESSLRRTESEYLLQLEGKKEPKKKLKTMTQFEKDALEKRLIDLLEKAETSDRDKIQDLIDRTTKIEPSSTLILALIDFYVRGEDVEKSSLWLQRLDDGSLRSSPNVVENVMSLWSKELGLRTPWRADELFKSITNRMLDVQTRKTSIGFSSIKIILDMWASSDDPGAHRKILDWFTSMISWSIRPDGTMLRLALKSIQLEKSALVLELVSLEIFKQWNELNHEDKVWLAQEVMAATASIGGETSKTVTNLLDRFQQDNITPTTSVYRSALNAIRPESSSPSDVLKLVQSMERNLEDIDLTLHTLAIHKLFQFDDCGAEVESLSNKVLDRIRDNISRIDAGDVSQFLENVMRMHTSRKLYLTAGAFLKNAETALLSSSDNGKPPLVSPIPLECYKRMIVRNWYTDKTAPTVKRLFQQLMRLYHSGYDTLRPDSEVYTGYMRACSAMGEDVEPIFRELILLYKSTGEEALKPTIETFNLVLFGYSRRNIKKIQAGNMSTKIIDLMLDLGVTPNTKSLNFALHNLIKCSNQYSFEKTMNLIKSLEEHNCKPTFDSFTLHYILDACDGNSTTNNDVALKKGLYTYRDIREKGMVGPTTYGILGKVLQSLLSKGDRADRVAGSILTLCCQDGRLTREVKNRFRSILSPSAWTLHYERNLAPNGEEPEEWSCNVPQESDSEDAA